MILGSRVIPFLGIYLDSFWEFLGILKGVGTPKGGDHYEVFL